MHTRRQFLGTSAMAALAAAPKDDISLAAWSLSRSFFSAHKWTNLELPKICREQFGIGGLEFVNQFFENPMQRYLRQLKRNAQDHGVTLVRIMVDDEGNMAAADRAERMEAAVSHRKWVDIAHFLGCRDIRCNMRGGAQNWKEDKDLVKRAAESFTNLLEYAKGSGIEIIIENHGGASSDPDVLAALMKAVNNPHFGTLPDFGNVNPGADHADVLRKLLPYAKGISVKASWDADGNHPRYDLEKLIRICLEFGYHGWWGIESGFGRARGQQQQELSPEQTWENDLKGVRLTKAVLDRVVLNRVGS